MTMPSRLLTMRQFELLTDLKTNGPRYVETCRLNTLSAMKARGFVEIRQLDGGNSRMCACITQAGRDELARG